VARLLKIRDEEADSIVEGGGQALGSTSHRVAGERPRAASPVTVVGKVVDSLEDCRRVASGER
jgi:hypothetical protein